MRREPEQRPLLIGALFALVVIALTVGSLLAVIVTARLNTRPSLAPPIPAIDVAQTTTVVVLAPAASTAVATPASVTATLELVAATSEGITPTPQSSRTPTASTVPPTATTAALPPTATIESTPTPAPIVPTLPPQPTAVAISSTVSAPGGNVRNGPGVSFASIGFVERNDAVIITGISNGWYLIRLGDTRSARSTITGEQGWVSSTLIAPPAQPVPFITPAPAP